MAAQTTRYDMARASGRKSRTKRSGQTHNPNPTAAPPFDLDRFEQLALSRHCGDVEQAFQMLHELLSAMELSRGGIPAGLSTQRPPGGPATPELERLTLLWTRIAHAISGLFLHPAFETMNLEGLQKLLLVQKQLAAIFHASSLESADACILAFDRAAPGQPFTIAQEDLYKVLLLYSLESRLGLELITGFDAVDRQGVLFSCIALCSTAFCGTRRSYERREEVLAYLCQQLERHELEEPALYLLTVTVYMYCSYANSNNKHRIKGLIHHQWRRRLQRTGLHDLNPKSMPIKDKDYRNHPQQSKPCLLILHEWFATGTAMNRCYASFIQALRDRFHLVGMGLRQSTNMDPAAIALFDEYVALPEGRPIPEVVRVIWKWCQTHNPDMVYYPSIGMGAHTVAAASLRLAPIQVMTAGHPATTHGSEVDYLIVPDSFDIDTSQISESLMVVSRHSIAWLPPKQLDDSRTSPYGDMRLRGLTPGYTSQAIISASPMKLGWPFLDFITKVHQRVQGHVHWHIFGAEGRGASHLEMRACVRSLLGDCCSVYPHLEYGDYVKALGVGDLFLTPFPFGNANTFFDYAKAQIVGCCLRGHELQSAGDAAFLEMLAFPSQLIASNLEDYVSTAARLILDPAWRLSLHEQIYGNHAAKTTAFTEGNPALTVNALHDLYLEHNSNCSKSAAD